MSAPQRSAALCAGRDTCKARWVLCKGPGLDALDSDERPRASGGAPHHWTATHPRSATKLVLHYAAAQPIMVRAAREELRPL